MREQTLASLAAHSLHVVPVEKHPARKWILSGGAFPRAARSSGPSPSEARRFRGRSSRVTSPVRDHRHPVPGASGRRSPARNLLDTHPRPAPASPPGRLRAPHAQVPLRRGEGAGPTRTQLPDAPHNRDASRRARAPLRHGDGRHPARAALRRRHLLPPRAPALPRLRPPPARRRAARGPRAPPLPLQRRAPAAPRLPAAAFRRQLPGVRSAVYGHYAAAGRGTGQGSK